MLEGWIFNNEKRVKSNMRMNFVVVVLCITTCAIAAPRRLGMMRQPDVTESPDNEVTVSVSVDGKDTDAYVPYIRKGSSVLQVVSICALTLATKNLSSMVIPSQAVLAGGCAIEDSAYNCEHDNEGEFLTVDWSDPGKQHKTVGKFDD